MNKKLLFVLLIGVIMTLPIGSTGTPDYGQSLSSNPTIQSYDAGEDTTRLLMGGGANSRGGRWLWATGFESGKGEFVDAGNVTIDNAIVYQGAAACLVQTTNVVNNQAWIQKNLYSPFSPDAANIRVGQEVLIFPVLVAPNGFDVRFFIQFPINASSSYLFEILLRYDGANTNLYVLNSSGMTLLSNINAYVGAGTEQFHYMKLVADGKTGMFVRFTFDNLVFDLSSIPGTLLVTPTSGQGILFYVVLKTTSAYANGMRLDNWILTGDEP